MAAGTSNVFLTDRFGFGIVSEACGILNKHAGMLIARLLRSARAVNVWRTVSCYGDRHIPSS